MRICHVTPHLPPDQAANALLPVHLGEWARRAGNEPAYVAYFPGRAEPDGVPGPVAWIRPRGSRNPVMRATRIGTLSTALRIVRAVGPAIDRADVVHLHSSGLLTEVASLIATWRRKPQVLTLYGTEIWHYRARRLAPDLFARAYRRAAVVTFYSEGLRARAQELGLNRRDLRVIYPPVAEQFTRQDVAGQLEARIRLGLRQRHVLLNAKRLHPLAGQRFLIEAMNEIIRSYPDTRLIICGAGPLRDELQGLARSNGVAGHVSFAGLVDNRRIALYQQAADLFVLPSLLEACPTVALEALACGTPVVSGDNPGGVELSGIFGADVTIVPRRNPMALARAIMDFLEKKRRARRETAWTLACEFAPDVVAEKYADAYRRALEVGVES
ncbi:MAG: glycosyltransferase [Acidobacteria bacterium]|nr:glycosyltransferase [Acidobacteriota bacterium]